MLKKSFKIIEDTFGSVREYGLFRYDGRSLQNVDPQVVVYALGLYEDSKHSLWVGSRDDGVWRYDLDGRAVTHFSIQDGLINNRVRDVLEDRHGHFWIVTEDGLSRYDGVQFDNHDARDGLSLGAHLAVIEEDTYGLFWIGGLQGLDRFHPDTLLQTGRAEKTFTTKDGLSHNKVNAIAQDKNGQLWFSTNGGISCYAPTSDNPPPQFVTFLDNNLIHALLSDREGHLWAGTDSAGLLRYDGPYFFELSQQDGLADNDVRSLLEDHNGYLWFGTAKGVTRYNPNSDTDQWTTFTTQHGLVHNSVFDLVEDQQGHIWISTEKEVSRYDSEGKWTTFTAQDGLPDDLVQVMLADRQGNVWFGTEEKGLGRYDGKQFTTYAEDAGILGSSVYALHEGPTDKIWVGGLWGVGRFEGESLVYKTGKSVRVIYEDANGVVWTYNGTSTYSLKDMTSKWTRLTSDNNQPFNFEISVMAEDHNGHLWFGTTKGIRRYNGAVWKAGEVVYRPDLWHDPAVVAPHNYVEQMNSDYGQPVRSLVHVPSDFGMLTLRSSDLDPFTPAQIELLKRVSELISLGFRRASDFEDLAQSAKDAEQANVAKSTFLANMSHEIRTPMNAILGYAQILDGDQRLHDDQRQAVETIGKSGHHLLGLINDVLDISKIEAGREELNPVDFDLDNMLDGISRMFEIRCSQKDLDWHLETDITHSEVHGDEGKMRQVLINMLGNAVKFTEEGEVRLRVKEVQIAEREVGNGKEVGGSESERTDEVGQNSEDTNHYAFAIMDTGPGIASEKHASIFEPFQQDEAGQEMGGTGLGLAISKRHVTLMNGRVFLESEIGKGSCFSVTVPLSPAQGSVQSQDLRDWTKVEKLAGGCTVDALVVDDRQTNRDVLMGLLSRIGVNVRTAENGEIALKDMREKMPDIVFIDIRMPVMDGPEMLKHVFEEFGRNATHLLAVTASVFDHQRKRYLDMGFEDFINKPVQAGEIYAALENI